MDGRTRAIQVLSWVLLAIAVVAVVGGVIYDGLRDGEDPDLSGLYFGSVAVGMVAMMLGSEVKRRSGGGRR
jgi:hypothetical protein